MPSYRRRRRREVPPLEVDWNGTVGRLAEPGVLGADWRESLQRTVGAARDAVQAAAPGFLDLTARRQELREVQELALGLIGRFDTVVVFGAGASAVGARLLGTLRPTGRIRRPRLHVADTVDPAEMDALLRRLDLRRTLFNVVSRSGDAPETMAQFLIVRDRLLRELGAVDYREHVVVTTDAERGSLRQIVNDEGFRALPIPPETPGAFALLTPVGTFPALVSGVDVEDLLDGAVAMAERCAAADDALRDPAAVLAGAGWALERAGGVSGCVVVPYGAGLLPLAEWTSQLWHGPVATVSHTELVRHCDASTLSGRLVLLVRGRSVASDVDIPVAYQDLADIGYLGGHTLGEVVEAEAETAGYLLARHGRPSIALTLPALTPSGLGQLIVMLQRAAATRAALDGRPVGEILDGEGARRVIGALLGRTGTDSEREAIARWRAQKDSRYIV